MWSAVLATHALLFVYGFFFDEMIAAVTAGTAAAFFVLWQGLRRDSMISLLPTLGFVAGNVISLGVFSLISDRWTNLPKFIAPDFTAWLVAALVWSAAVGGLLVDRALAHQHIRVASREELTRVELLAVTALSFAFVAIGMFAAGFLDQRWVVAEAGFGLGYLVHGLDTISYSFFFILGCHFRGQIGSSRDLAILALVGSLALMFGLSGGREHSMWMILLLIAGAAAGGMPARRLIVLIGWVSIVGALFFSVIGTARGVREFRTGTVSQRLSAVGDATDDLMGNDGGQDDFDEFVNRVCASTAHDIIAQSIAADYRAGFDDFERLAYLFIPKAIAPEKPAINDSKEILIRDFGYNLSVLHSVPITLVGDAFRRGREPWVLGVGFATGVVLRLLPYLAALVVPAALFVPCIVLLSISSLRAYGSSVLGMFDRLVYRGTKLIFLILVLGMVASLLGLLLRASRQDRVDTGPRGDPGTAG